MSATDTEIETCAQVLNPLVDPRWPLFLERHPSSSIFHSREWLQALQVSFGYEPVVITTAGSAEDLQNGVPLCVIKSRLTGNRVVSLPFSDHCEVLGASQEDVNHLVNVIADHFSDPSLSYVELRPLHAEVDPIGRFRPSDRFVLHKLDLSPPLERIFNSLHRDSIQRRIRRARGAGLRYEIGNSEALILAFYRLHIETRRRLGLPPFPLKWFRALTSTLNQRMQIRVAFLGERPIASIVCLQFKDSMTYKYGASDSSFHRLGAIPFLFWQAIEEAKTAKMRELDFGRSEATSLGLLRFKRRWGTRESSLTYWQAGHPKTRYERSYKHKSLAQRVFVHTPRPVLVLLAQLYRHLG